MRGIRPLAILGWTLATGAAIAPAQSPSAWFVFGANTYPLDILDVPRPQAEAEHPELFLPPAIGDAFTLRVRDGSLPVRELTGTVISSNILECLDGPDIFIHDDIRLDLLRDLFMTDLLHHAPQTGGDEPPSPPHAPPPP